MKYLVLLSFCVFAQGSPWLSSLNVFSPKANSTSTSWMPFGRGENPSTSLLTSWMPSNVFGRGDASSTNSTSFLTSWMPNVNVFGGETTNSVLGLFSNLAEDRRDQNFEVSRSKSSCFLASLMETIRNATSNTIASANNAIKSVGASGTKLLTKVGVFPLNRGADVLVNKVKSYMETDEIELPNLNQHFSFITLNAQNGKFGKMESLKRNGDVSFYPKGKYFYIEIPLKFDKIYVDYDFQVLSFFANFQGGLRAEINSNNFILKLRLSSERNCVFTLESVQITDLNGIDIKFNGLDQDSEDMIKYTMDGIKDDLETIVKQQVQATIDNKIVEYTQENNIKCSDFE